MKQWLRRWLGVEDQVRELLNIIQDRDNRRRNELDVIKYNFDAVSQQVEFLESEVGRKPHAGGSQKPISQEDVLRQYHKRLDNLELWMVAQKAKEPVGKK